MEKVKIEMGWQKRNFIVVAALEKNVTNRNKKSRSERKRSQRPRWRGPAAVYKLKVFSVEEKAVFTHRFLKKQPEPQGTAMTLLEDLYSSNERDERKALFGSVAGQAVLLVKIKSRTRLSSESLKVCLEFPYKI